VLHSTHSSTFSQPPSDHPLLTHRLIDVLNIKWCLVFQVTISPKTTVTIDLPTDFSLFKVGAYSGLEISLSAGPVIKATLTTSLASATAAASITAGMQAACLRFDVKANAYTYVDGASYANKTMTVDLPKAGLYMFVSASATVPIPTIYAEARATSSTSVKIISYGGGELTLGVQTTTDNKITCTKKSSSTTRTPSGKTSINTFFDIELEKEEKVQKGEIKYKYDAAAVRAVRTDPSRSTSAQTKTSFAHTCTRTCTHLLSAFCDNLSEPKLTQPTLCFLPYCLLLLPVLRREQARRRCVSCLRTKRVFGQRCLTTILMSTSTPKSS